MKKLALLAAMVIAVLTANCAKPQSGEPTPAPEPATVKTAATGVQGEWDKLAAAARQEGRLLIAAGPLGETKHVISKAFREKFGVDIEYMEAFPTEVVARVVAQRNAGLYLVDVGHFGDSTLITDLRPYKVSTSLGPLLFLPEVVDGKNWRGGKLPFLDADHHMLTFVAMVIPPAVVNTDLVKANEITRNADLLNPKWKGKVVLNDPTTSGTSNNWFTHVVVRLYKTREDGLQFMREFARQEPIVVRDYRLLSEWVAKGKYLVGVGQSMPIMDEFMKAGAPIAYAGLADPAFLSAGVGNVIVFDKAPHPNAAKLYLNWVLSKEGSQLFAPAFGYPSLRVDIANTHIDPTLIPPLDATIVAAEDYIAVRAEMRAAAREVFKDVLH